MNTGSRTNSPPSEPPSPVDGGLRKRVCKACDRCRLKKSKCDGSSPCGRCKSDNAICVFGERKKSHDKVYPKGYVEMLEHQQAQLVTGLQELYRRLRSGEGWNGAPLQETSRGTPLTHDILERLGALQQESTGGAEEFHEDLNAMQSILLAKGAGYMKREMSFDTNSDIDQSPIFEPAVHHKMPTFTNPFPSQFPPTPPLGSPHPSTVKTSSPLKSSFTTAPAQMPGTIPWQSEPAEFDNMDFSMYDAPVNDVNLQAMLAAQAQMFQEPTGIAINPCLTMKHWPEHDDRMPQQFYQGGLYT